MAIEEKTLRLGIAGLGVGSTQVLPGVARFPALMAAPRQVRKWRV